MILKQLDPSPSRATGQIAHSTSPHGPFRATGLIVKYQFHSGTMLVSPIFLSRLSAWHGSPGMVALCQTELSPELCSRLAKNTLIIKKIVERAQQPLMSKTLSLTF